MTSTSTEGTEEIPDYVDHEIEHYTQRFNWDCGVSCVLMLLSKEQRTDFLQNFTKICEEEGFRQSTWTIDLCYLLKRYDIKHCMYTTNAGVNEDYQKQRYYEKIISLDGERVRARFAMAAGAGVTVREARLGGRQLARHVARAGPAIVLLDAALLTCDLCRHNRARAYFTHNFGGAYRGHYVVAVGLQAGRLVYRDPALGARLCAVPPRRLAAARARRGTDHDVVLVYRR